MVIKFKESKECKCYEAFVENPTDRNLNKKFTGIFNSEIAKASVKTHQRLKNFESANAYNKVYGSSDNRIELLSAQEKKDALVLKTRINGDYRKFFHTIIDQDYLIKENWTGQFDEVKHIYVYEINKHNYKKA